MNQDAALLAARWIAGAMKAAGISQAELAQRMGIDPTYVSKLVNGKSDARLSTVVKALTACGCEIVKLQVRPPKSCH